MNKLFILPILSFLVVACSSTPDVNEVIVEQPQKADTIVEVIEPEIEQVEQMSFAFQGNIDAMEVCYVSNGELFVLNHKTNESILIPDDNSVINCAFESDGENESIAYIIDNDGTAQLRIATFDKDSVFIEIAYDFEVSGSDFITDTYGEPADIRFRNGRVEGMYGYVWMEGFRQKYVYYSEDKSLDDDLDLSEFYSALTPNGSTLIESNLSGKVKEIDSLDKNEFYFFARDTIKLTNTEKYVSTENEGFEDEYEFELQMDVISVSPTGDKFCFDVIAAMGDLPHGPQVVVDTTGTLQLELNTDGVASNIKPKWLIDGSLIYKSDEGFQLLTIENKMINIAENVSYYSVK